MSSRTISQMVNLAVEHHSAGRLAEAEGLYRQILAEAPNHAVTLNLLGVLAGQVGKCQIGLELIQHAIAIAPQEASFHANLGLVLKKMGRLDEAIASYRQAIKLKPDFVEAYNNLGNALNARGQNKEAMECFRKLLVLKPELAEGYNNLGNSLKDDGQLEEAMGCFRRALELKPNYAEAHNNLGNGLMDHGAVGEALGCYRKALECRPGFLEAQQNLGAGLADAGELEAAKECFWRVMELTPDSPKGYDNLLYLLHYDPASSRQSLYETACQWNRKFAAPLRKQIHPHTNERQAGRRLRVGYVSPDFRSHPVGRFMMPLWAGHDRGNFEVFGYSLHPASDALTEKLRTQADGWRSLVGMTDEAATDLIREDKIDILVDLAMHTAGNRLQIFARKPAPVQVTYLAYAGGTGVDAMDYRLTDNYLDPDAAEDRFYLEKSFRLRGTYWCYQQSLPTPEVGELPAAAGGGVTFGCLNNFAKVNRGVLDTWAELLRKTPDSRLMLYCPVEEQRQRLREYLREQGIVPERLELVGRMAGEDYFKAYQRMDLALDPFPYSGGTTSCDALWMGVPVITLAGRTAVGRSGVSILRALGHGEWIGQTAEEYSRIARELAGDIPRLRELRKNLREQMQHSPLMDTARFTRDIENAYRTMWQAWCE